MRRCTAWLAASSASSGLLAVLQDAAVNPTVLTCEDVVTQPQIAVRTLPFIPPPRWAAELSRRLQKQFGELEQVHHSRYLQAFIHPSFTSAAGASGTMQPLTRIGEAVLTHFVTDWVLITFDGLKREELSSLLSTLLSDRALSGVLRDHWQLENMVLTDAAADLFSREKVRSTKGLARWLASSGTQSIPDPFAADCLRAMIGAVFAEHGYEACASFAATHVLPYLP